VGFLLLIPALQFATGAADQPPGRIGGYQRDDPGALGLGEPRLRSGPQALAEPIDPLKALKRWIRSLTV
jgi:hypothetical protein